MGSGRTIDSGSHRPCRCRRGRVTAGGQLFTGTLGRIHPGGWFLPIGTPNNLRLPGPDRAPDSLEARVRFSVVRWCSVRGPGS